MKTKKIITFMLALMFLISLVTIAQARKGVGIVWNTQTEIVNEGEQHCISYGVYNPWDEGVDASITVTGELEEVITNAKSDTEYIAPETGHNAAVPIELCFKVPKVYEKECVVPGVGCEQTCTQEEQVYEGEVLVLQKSEGDGTGSATTAGVTAPLKLKVKCTPHGKDWAVLLVMLILLIGLGTLYKSYKGQTKK